MRDFLLSLTSLQWFLIFLALWLLLYLVQRRRSRWVVPKSVQSDASSYRLLMSAVLGDRAKAERLIDYERRRGAVGRDDAISSALDRLHRDNMR